MELRKINKNNIWEVLQLKVMDGQENFIATNTESIIEAYITITNNMVALPFGIYNNDILVGFVMFGYGSIGDDEEPTVVEDSYCIWRFMLDQSFQGQGFGKQAMQVALDYIETYPCGKAKYVWLSYEKENTIAKMLYHKMGFEETGEICEGEIIAVRKL